MDGELQDTLWRSALTEFDRLADLSDAARGVELGRLARESPDLHQRVRALLEADRRASEGGFLDGDALADVTTGEQQEPGWTLQPDACFGPYRVERPLGKGGMGEVWLARRADGRYEGQVALKFLHPQLSSSAIRQRFAREGQILARLAHPRIARLLDAGVTSGGRLYLVLEYVAGEPLDTWCNARRLDVRARLALFLQICDAVAHAHAHLVLHRDLKPSNILVADDGRIKLLDFGVAKLVGADTGAAAPTELTEAGGRVFTPEYAAPEQLTNQPATIATDVYALGVVLYRLLTGRRPYGEEARSLGQLERAILEVDPPRMSASLRDADVAALASTHGCTPIHLQRILRGGLDLIVGKCLRKAPSDRYATVRSLADDVTRHLDHRPLLAQPEPWATRGRKFVRRHLVGVAAVAGMLIASAAGVSGVVWQARQTAIERDQAQREAARAEAVRDYVMLMFRTARDEAGETPLTARQVLDLSAARLRAEYRDDPALRHRLLQTVAQLYTELDDYQGAASLLEGMVQAEASTTDPVVLADAQHLLANIAFRRGDAARARLLLAQAQAFWQRDASRYRGPLLESRLLQAQLERESGDVRRSIATLRTVVSDRQAQSGAHHYDTVNAMNSLALALAGDNQLAEAERLIGQAWDGVRALGRERSGWALVILNNRAGIAARQTHYTQAEALFREAITLRRDLYGPSTALAVMHINLASILINTGRPREAADLLSSALRMATEYSGENSPVTVSVLVKLARAHLPLRNVEEAERHARRALEIGRGRFGGQHVLVVDAETILAKILIEQKQVLAARPLLEHAAATLPRLGAVGAPLQAEVNELMSQLALRRREP